MKVVAYGQPERLRGLAASLRGLARLGLAVEVVTGKPGKDFAAIPCDFAVIEGTRSEHRWVYEAHRDDPDAPPLVILEYGYLKRATDPNNEDGLTWQVSIGNLGWVPNFKCAPDRFIGLGIEVKPLREPNPDYPIIVVGDHPGYIEDTGDFRWPEIRHWALSALEEIRKHTNRRVFWRPHPRQAVGIYGFNGLSTGPIDWSKQWACVVFNSNTGNEALIEGCPVFTDGWAGFRQVSNTALSQIENPKLPDLTDYLHRLAHAQWFIPEIEQGAPFAEYIEKGMLP